MEIIVYLVECKQSGKHYVGITSRSADYRLQEHIKCALEKNVKTPFYHAIRLHGADSFETSELQRCESWEEACQAERKWIAELQTHVSQGGYNATTGGDGIVGYVFTPEQRERKSVGQRNSPHFKRFPVCQIDEKGNVISHYRTVEEASIATGISHIMLALTGKRNSAGGYFWCSPENLESFLKTISERPAPFKTFEIEQLTLDGVHVKTFKTIAIAQRETGIRHIYEASDGTIKSAGGFLWRRL